MYYILSVCIETGNISVKELLLPTELHSTTRYIGGPTLFVTATGSLSLFWLQVEGLALDIWTETDDGAWPYARRVKPTPPKNWNPSLVHMWSGEGKRGLLVLACMFEGDVLLLHWPLQMSIVIKQRAVHKQQKQYPLSQFEPPLRAHIPLG
jgi:hypothetical protein